MKKLGLILLVCFWSATAFSQKYVDDQTGWSFKERGYFGLGFGGLGLGRSNVYGNYFSIGVTPLAGYMLTKNLSSGLAFEYQYTSYSDLKVRIHQYGGYPFLRYNIRNFFIQTDYDLYSMQADFYATEKERVIVDRFFVGAGYSSHGGGRSAFNVLVSYDLLYTNTSRFNSPLSVRAFMTF